MINFRDMWKQWSKADIAVWRKSLSVHLLGVFFLLIVVVVLGLTMNTISRGSARAQNALQAKAELLAYHLASASRVGVFSENKDVLKDVAESIVSEPDVVFVGIFNNDMRPLYLMRKTPVKKGLNPGSVTKEGLNGTDWNDALAREKDLLIMQKPVLLKHYVNPELEVYLEQHVAEATFQSIGLVKIAVSGNPRSGRYGA